MNRHLAEREVGSGGAVRNQVPDSVVYNNNPFSSSPFISPNIQQHQQYNQHFVVGGHLPMNLQQQNIASFNNYRRQCLMFDFPSPTTPVFQQSYPQQSVIHTHLQPLQPYVYRSFIQLIGPFSPHYQVTDPHPQSIGVVPLHQRASMDNIGGMDNGHVGIGGSTYVQHRPQQLYTNPPQQPLVYPSSYHQPPLPNCQGDGVISSTRNPPRQIVNQPQPQSQLVQSPESSSASAFSNYSSIKEEILKKRLKLVKRKLSSTSDDFQATPVPLSTVQSTISTVKYLMPPLHCSTPRQRSPSSPSHSSIKGEDETDQTDSCPTIVTNVNSSEPGRDVPAVSWPRKRIQTIQLDEDQHSAGLSSFLQQSDAQVDGCQDMDKATDEPGIGGQPGKNDGKHVKKPAVHGVPINRFPKVSQSKFLNLPNAFNGSQSDVMTDVNMPNGSQRGRNDSENVNEGKASSCSVGPTKKKPSTVIDSQSAGSSHPRKKSSDHCGSSDNKKWMLFGDNNNYTEWMLVGENNNHIETDTTVGLDLPSDPETTDTNLSDGKAMIQSSGLRTSVTSTASSSSSSNRIQGCSGIGKAAKLQNPISIMTQKR